MIISLLPDSERDVDGVCQGKHKSTVTENCIKLPRVNSIPPTNKKNQTNPQISRHVAASFKSPLRALFGYERVT